MNLRQLSCSSFCILVAVITAVAQGPKKQPYLIVDTTKIAASTTSPTQNIRFFASAAETGGAVSLFETTEMPGYKTSLHRHPVAEETFLVLEGTIILDVAGERVEIGPGEFCCFPDGLPHAVVETIPPLRTFMLRAPSVEDKFTQPV